MHIMSANAWFVCLSVFDAALLCTEGAPRGVDEDSGGGEDAEEEDDDDDDEAADEGEGGSGVRKLTSKPVR